DNVRVRAVDGQPFLLDFGSAHYVGAATLTVQAFPPGTPAYRSPEAWRYLPRSGRPPSVPYAPGPADDVFALGVTAFRLVTGKYPPPTHPDDEDAWMWRPEEMKSWSARAINARCCVELSALVSRMLSPHPEARGSAREVAESLELAARKAGAEADRPLFTGEEPQPAGLMPPPQHVTAPPRREARRPWLTAASLGAAMALGVAGVLSLRAIELPATRPQAAQEEARDGGTSAVGDSALTAAVEHDRAPFEGSTLAVDVPPKPFPGQRRPNASGRCPNKGQVSINGGCWVKLPVDVKDCDGEDSFVYNGACYAPVLARPRPPTSGPAKRSAGQ
ncbi:serine/threonine protein kinase, partial [Pyxidicoccus sp. 3LFB2]